MLYVIVRLMQTMVRRVCVAVKHVVLDYAHPFPDAITLFPGRDGSIDCAMVRHVVRALEPSDLTIVDAHPHNRDEERTTIWVHRDDHNDLAVTGAFAACRYLTRLWRLNPITPTSALIVDALLERLQRFVVQIERSPDTVVPTLVALIADMEHHGFDMAVYLGGMHMESVCDLLYVATVRFALAHTNTTISFYVSSSPCVQRWWEAMGEAMGEATENDDCVSLSDVELSSSPDDKAGYATEE